MTYSNTQNSELTNIARKLIFNFWGDFFSVPKLNDKDGAVVTHVSGVNLSIDDESFFAELMIAPVEAPHISACFARARYTPGKPPEGTKPPVYWDPQTNQLENGSNINSIIIDRNEVLYIWDFLKKYYSLDLPVGRVSVSVPQIPKPKKESKIKTFATML